MAEKIFPQGMYADKPHEKAPSYVIARTSYKVEEFKAFLDAHKNDRGYVNIDILKSQKGTFYGVLNTYVADMTKPSSLSDEDKSKIADAREKHNENVSELNYPEEEIKPSDIPF